LLGGQSDAQMSASELVLYSVHCECLGAPMGER
jgi:hypothetical protein